MSLPVPLMVRLSTTRADRHITRELRSLSFRENAIGGYASAAFALDRPLLLAPDEIAHYARVYIYDARNGATVWEGRLDDPDRGAGADGQVWNLVAVGPSAHTMDRAVPLIYVDRDMQAFGRAVNLTPGGSDSITEDPGGSGKDALVLQFGEGLTVAQNNTVTMRYPRIARAGQKLARLDYSWDAGGTDTNYAIQAIASTDGGASDTARNQTLAVGGGAASPRVVVTDWSNGRNTLDLRLIRTAAGSQTIPNDGFWVSVMDFYVQAMRYNADGTEKTSSYVTTPNVSDIVADLLGRLLPMYDGAGAVVALTGSVIVQLAYPDGVTAAKVLEDLVTLATGYRWGVYESNTAGKYRFEWVAWPSAVRYEADIVDGFESPASASELYNEVTVRYRNEAGEALTTTRSQSVQILTDGGLTRTAIIDLSGEVGLLANAQLAGDQFLLEHGTPLNRGRLHLARPVLDLGTGRMVMPWEIKAGELIRVRGVLPRVDALNATSRDGVAVFRIASKDVNGAEGTATLDLDSFSGSVPRAVVQVASSVQRRRRYR